MFYVREQKVVQKQCFLTSVLRPLHHCSAVMAGTSPAVSGYKSSLKSLRFCKKSQTSVVCVETKVSFGALPHKPGCFQIID